MDNFSMRRAIQLGMVLFATVSFARDKTPYQSTKLVELQAQQKSFCFVVQLDDLAYVAVADIAPTSNLIVGDPVQIKPDKDKLRLMTNKKWPDVEPDGSVKASILVRQRMSAGTKLPTCALVVSVH